MLIKKPADILSSEITPKSVYMNRRKFMAGVAAAGAAALITGHVSEVISPSQKVEASGTKLQTTKSPLSTTETQTSFKDITNYNNFYEFSTEKYGPAELAKNFKTHPWRLTVEGAVAKKKTFDIDTLMGLHALEDRIYRHRCVEGWSMVIPWVGYSLSELVNQTQPTSKAKYVEFETLYDPGQMPGQKAPVLDWPYTEGLRMDEAMHPLALLCFGLYGETLPNQDGAPVRIVVPWKYGFKSIKSIVKVRFVENQPKTAWNTAAPNEYGFYSNVNPDKDHPRWSQKYERVIGGGLFSSRKKTQMFNGYGDQVASLYNGMDLKKYY
jgi:methionine sulfoxide reductase catalytic subunit